MRKRSTSALAAALATATASAAHAQAPDEPWCMSKSQTECYYDANRDAREAILDKVAPCADQFSVGL